MRVDKNAKRVGAEERIADLPEALNSAHHATRIKRDFSEAFNVSFDVEPTGEATFDGSISAQDFGRLKIAQLEFSPHRTRRSRLTPLLGSSTLLFNRQVSGRLVVHQDGRAAEIGPGDMYMLNPAREFELDTESIVVHTIAVEASLIRGVFPEVDCCLGIKLPTEGAPSLFSSVIDGLVKWSPTLDAAAQTHLTSSIPHLMAAALSTGLNTQEILPSRLQALHKERIKSFARDNLADPDLSCAMIADALRLSQRYIYDILADEPMTLMRWIRRERLLRCQRELASTPLAQRSIGEIAYSWGFVELAHFSRAFSAEFGQSPRAFRRSSLASAADS